LTNSGIPGMISADSGIGWSFDDIWFWSRWNWFRVRNWFPNVQHRGIGWLLYVSALISIWVFVFNFVKPTYFTKKIESVSFKTKFFGSLLSPTSYSPQWLESKVNEYVSLAMVKRESRRWRVFSLARAGGVEVFMGTFL
jgi:hypothetical protein